MTIRSTAAVAGGLLLLAGAAQAAPNRTETARAAQAAPQLHPVAAVERDEEALCSRARRRLWIAGEGWLVRRVTTCR